MARQLTNLEVAKLLRNVAAALLIKGKNRFRIVAYEKAADSIEHLTSEVKDLWEEEKLDSIPGVGAALAQHLDELFKNGSVRHFEHMFTGLSPALFTFLEIPGMGPKRAYQLTKEFKINDPKKGIDSLEKLAKEGKIAKLPGWGEKSQAELVSSIAVYKKGQIKENRMLLPKADVIAQELIEYLKKVAGVKRVDVLGSLRRKVSTIGDIDLSVATTDPHLVLDAFVSFPKVQKQVDRGDKGATVLLNVGRQVDLRVTNPTSYGAMLQYFTGSKLHNIKLREHALKLGLSLSEHGIKLLPENQKSLPRQQAGMIKNQKFNKQKNLFEFKSEEDFYQALGMDWIPPEMREDGGEIEAAIQHTLPRLIETKDLKGDVHIHSNYDLKPSHDLGNSSLEELLEKAAHLSFEYIGVSDHNPSVTNQSEKKILDIMKRRKEKLEELYYSWKKKSKKRIQLFIMLEVDIDPKGNLALPDKAFEYVDAVVVSIHSSFTQDKSTMTKRVLAGLTHPKAKIFGHPTARLLDKRDEIDLNWGDIFGFCLENNKALEINSWPERLDLPDRLVREAVTKGVKLVINTDSHAANQMTGISYGVDVARRGWAEKKDILNTMEYNDFTKWLKR